MSDERVVSIKSVQIRFLMMALFLFVYILAFVRVNDRVSVTMVGYELGKLKNKEKELIESVANLENRLAKLTSMQSLEKYSKK